jgi:hypothetical protein
MENQFQQEKDIFTSTLDLNIRNKIANCYVWNITLCGVETWTLQKVDHKYLRSS